MTVTATTPLYRSSWGLLPFQQEAVIRACTGNTLAALETGLGKTHVGLASAALLFEGEQIDLTLLICEQNKLIEWLEDLATYTDLRAVAYGGPGMTLAHRRKVMGALSTDEPVTVKRGLIVDRPQVLVGTYETFRNDLMVSAVTTNASGRKVKSKVVGPLAEALTGKRVFMVYDEMTKLGNRGTGIHRAQEMLIKHLAKSGGSSRLLGLTATPIERDPENYRDLGRLLCPKAIGTIKSFETDHILYRDAYGRGTFKNLTPETTNEHWVTPLSTKLGSVLLRKRWTDDDVRTQFPEVTPEKFVHVRLGDKHQEFYETVRDVFDSEDEDKARPLFTLLRMIAGHPLALLGSQGEIARTIVREVGEGGLKALGSAKLDMLTDRLIPIVKGEGSQVAVFTFFGPTMIPLIADRLEAEGMTVAQNFPDMGDKLRREHLADFNEGNRRVFLSSDAGARGINLYAKYVVEYDMALTHANRTQRMNRIKRLDSKAHGIDRIYMQSLVAHDTVEEGIANGVMRRNAWSDSLLEDGDPGEHFVTATMRRELLNISRGRA